MIKERSFEIRQFFLMLKLGIWHQGQVANWGYVSCPDTAFISEKKNLIKHISFFKHSNESQLIFIKQLDIGLYLLNTSCLYSSSELQCNIHEVTIGVCRTVQEKPERIYKLKVVNKSSPHEFTQALLSGTALIPMRKRKSILRKSKTVRRFDNSPIHSEKRKY